MTYDRSELSSALADVRRAYRLLWGYQRRMEDLARTFSQHLGFGHYYEEPEKKGGWKQLPMISYGYLFVRRIKPDEDYLRKEWPNYPAKNDMLLYLWLESDREYTRAFEKNKREPVPTEFEDANQSKSLLHSIIYINNIDRTENTNWLRVAVTDRGTTDGKIKDHRNVNNLQIFGLTFDLVDLGDERVVLDAAEKLKSAFTVASGVPWPSAAEQPYAVPGQP